MDRPTLIVNADDFGISESVNVGIVRAHTHGIVTSTTLLATGDAFDHALAQAQDCPRLDIGLHLALVGQRPLLPPSRVRSLVGENSRFHGSVFAFTGRYYAGRIDATEVEDELEAQIERVRNRVAISHVDSHQHVHMLPGIRAVVIRLCRRHGIPAMRWPSEPIRPQHMANVSALPRVAQLAALSVVGRLGKRGSISTPDFFFGFLRGGRLDETSILQTLDALPGRGSCELMCHPGLDDAALHYPDWGYHWGDELKGLTSPAVRRRIEELGIRLTSYRELFPATAR